MHNIEVISSNFVLPVRDSKPVWRDPLRLCTLCHKVWNDYHIVYILKYMYKAMQTELRKWLLSKMSFIAFANDNNTRTAKRKY